MNMQCAQIKAATFQATCLLRIESQRQGGQSVVGLPGFDTAAGIF